MKITKSIFFISIASLSFSWMPGDPSSPATIRNKTKAGAFINEPPTLICAGFEWTIFGDENRNASVSVAYRKKGMAEWQKGLPLLRMGGEKVYGHDQRWVYTVPTMFAGSLFNLEPGTVYECKFLLADPDGMEGRTERQVFVETKREPSPYEHGQVYHVYPPGQKAQNKARHLR